MKGTTRRPFDLAEAEATLLLSSSLLKASGSFKNSAVSNTSTLIMSTYQKVTLAKRPTDNIIPGETFKLEHVPVPKESDLKDGEVIYETRYLSLDPAMRGWLNGKQDRIHVLGTTR